MLQRIESHPYYVFLRACLKRMVWSDFIQKQHALDGKPVSKAFQTSSNTIVVDVAFRKVWSVALQEYIFVLCAPRRRTQHKKNEKCITNNYNCSAKNERKKKCVC